MIEWLQVAVAVAGKDLRLEWRTRSALLSAVVFAALVLVIFNFARDPTAVATTDLAPSILWVTFGFAAIVALNRAFTVERHNGALQGLLLAPVGRSALFLGKYLANLVFVGLVEMVALPLFVLFFNIDLSRRAARAPAGHRCWPPWDSWRSARCSAPWRCAPGSPS